jgi:hypothetical protein
MRGLRRKADEAQVAEMVSEAHALPPRFSHERSEVRIHAYDHRHKCPRHRGPPVLLPQRRSGSYTVSMNR